MVWAVLLAGGLLAGCTAEDGDPADAGQRASSSAPDRWADIDTSRPSEDPVGTVYGYVQAMAQDDAAAACAFQYRGSSDYDDDPCVLTEEMPRRDRRRTAEDWAALAGFRLQDYRAADAGRLWRVRLPAAGAVWRVRQDDAGIWFVG